MPFIAGSRSINAYRMTDGDVVAEVPLCHRLCAGVSRDDMIATIGYNPCSVVTINDRHDHEQRQLVELSCEPVAVAIRPAQDTVAVMLENGISTPNCIS